ncbi:chemotaxis protein MotB [Candidatus Magnetomorum sp. HK-1]|nr:chemotaxis protein MotB [Candidatus Magnetomorum sp. HK-1]
MIRIFEPRRSLSPDEDNPYWISFSDIMAGLLVIFILACVLLIIKLSNMEEKVHNAIKEIQKANKIRATMLVEIRNHLAEQGIIVEISENYSVLRIPDDRLYFDSLRYEIPEDKKRLLDDIGYALYDAIVKKKRHTYIDTIFIEGHTDSRKAVSFEMGNWGLSTYRAIAVWKYWSEELDVGRDLKLLKNSYGKPMFSVSGYAATRPLVKNDNTVDKQRKNRRIDLRFSMKKPIISEYESVLNILEILK